MKITQKYLAERYDYCETGYFLRKSNGTLVKGSENQNGYRYFGIRLEKTTLIRYHRAIYLYHHGTCPAELDHVNGNRLDNRIENLRPATRQQNCLNKPSTKGVYRRKQGTFWSMITVNGKQIYLGTFKTQIEARQAYEEAARKHSSAITPS